MEKWDVYDKDGKLTGRTKTKNDVFESGEYHLGVSLWIINHQGELLIQKRSVSKRIHPNNWSTTGGSVISGETSAQGCIRETKEEIGLQLYEDDLVFLSRSYGKNMISDDYATIQEFPIENAIIQINEVSEVKWASAKDVARLFSLGLFMSDDLKDLENISRYIDEHIRV